MSAFAVKVSPDKQTLILAGEAIPPRANADRGVSGSDLRLQLQRVTMLLVQGDYAPTTLAADASAAKFLGAAGVPALLPSPAAIDASAAPTQSPIPYGSPKRALSAGGAAEYARTQNLSGGGTRSQLIDTYA